MPATYERQIDVVVSPEELRVFEEAAFASLARELSVPGFRAGHVPDDVARERIPSERIFREAMERAVAERGRSALESIEEEIVGEPRIDIRKAAPGNPLEFRMTVSVLPDVPLENWKSLRIPFRPLPVLEQDVDDAVEELRRSRATFLAVRRGARRGDLVEVDFVTRVDGALLEGGSSKKHPILLGEGRFIPGFEDALAGMGAGEEKVVTLPFPRDWPKAHLRGKEGEFTIVIHNVQERLLPDLDDSFAKSLGASSEGLAGLRASIRDGLAEERHAAEKRRVRAEALERLGERIDSVRIPEVLLEQEVERMREELKFMVEQQGFSLAEYLQRIGKREEDLGVDWRDGALRRVKAALVVRALAKKEAISVDEREIEEKAQEELRRMHRIPNAQHVDFQQLKAYSERSIREEKVMELIDSVVTNNAK